MIPVLYAASETAYTSLGYGGLCDAISCEVHQEINGEYELFMQYPIGGAVAQYIAVGTVIKAAVDTDGTTQLFRVYRTTKPISGIFSVYARHVMYDAAGVPVAPFTAAGLTGFPFHMAIDKINDSKMIDSPCTVAAEFKKSGTFKTTAPESMFSLMGQLISRYGGEWVYDNFTATLVNRIGEDKNTVIAYGKNLITLEQDTNCADVYTAVLPFYSEGQYYVAGDIVHAQGTYPVEKVLLLDLTDQFEDVPSKEELLTAVQHYISDNRIGVPNVSLTVQFVDLSNTTDAVLGGDPIRLGDTITVRFEAIGVDAAARVTSVNYNVLADRYESVHIGDSKKNIAATISEQQGELGKKQNAIFSTSAGGKIVQKVDGEREWLNPPMVPGVEYRTVDRFNGKAVFVKVIDCGNLPNTTEKSVAHGITGDVMFLSIRVMAGIIGGTQFGFSKTEGDSVKVSGANVVIRTLWNAQDYKAYAFLKYVKN